MSLPFKETHVKNNEYIREFDENIPTHELEWHLDKEDRLIEVVENVGNWLVQLDNSLPVSLDKKIFIPKETYHRVIKGTGKLVVKIKKFI
jgi:hypothetical protein